MSCSELAADTRSYIDRLSAIIHGTDGHVPLHDGQTSETLEETQQTIDSLFERLSLRSRPAAHTLILPNGQTYPYSAPAPVSGRTVRFCWPSAANSRTWGCGACRAVMWNWVKLLQQAAKRELMEETGIFAEVPHLVDCLNFISNGDDGRSCPAIIVVAVYTGPWIAGVAQAHDDAADVTWRRPDALGDLPTTDGVREVIAKAHALMTAE